jgi:ketosteroid isomerase-like protein
VASKGTFITGDSYSNEYVLMLNMRETGEGKMEITEMREFVDSAAMRGLGQIVEKIRATSAE